MSAKFYTLLTDIGAAKLANAAALGVPLKITQMAVGDGGGVLPTPNAQQTKLVGEKRRAALNMLYIDPQNSSQVIAEQVIPETEGGWWIREVGLFDETGALIAVGNCPESYKPQLAEGSGRTQTVRMVLITSSTDNITLKIDPSVVLATRKYVDDKVLELKVDVDELMAAHLAAADPHSQYAPKASPTFIGTPKAPTAAAGNNSTQLANTAFVQSALVALGGGSTLPVGTPIPWPTAVPPNGWLKCNGATFSATQYPKLAQAYPGLVLPDLRAEFIRGWDDGRGVDSSRTLLSGQKGSVIPGDDGLSTPNVVGINNLLNNNSVWGMDQAITAEMTGCYIAVVASTNSSNTVQTNIAGIVRPRNIAFNYIVRAE